ncbi:MAG: hypothetical protein WBD07_13915 [Vicinamibacterales bacterium]
MRHEFVFEEAQAVPADEGAEQVDGIGGWDFVGERVGEGRLAAGVDQQIGGRQWDQRRDDVAVVGRRACDRLDGAQQCGRTCDEIVTDSDSRRIVRGDEEGNELVCDGDSSILG